MDAEQITAMFNFANSLSHKREFTGPEWGTYQKALTFTELYYEFNSLALREQVRKLRDDEASRDKEQTIE
jgi:hypothetical protein